MSESIKSTSLIEIRDFLWAHHCAAAPWAHPGAAVENLFQALQTKKDDVGFWVDLKNLTARLEDVRFNPSPILGSDILPDHSLATLIDELKISLGSGNGCGLGVSPLRHWLGKPLGLAALLAFLLLGAAVGCNEESDPAEPEWQSCPEADINFANSEQSQVYCELVNIIEEASVGEWVKESMLACLPELDALYRENLLNIFQSSSDQELANLLEQMTGVDGVCYQTGFDDNTDWYDDDTYGYDDDH